MTPNYERILSMAVEDGIKKGLYSLEHMDLDNLNEDEVLCSMTEHVMTEIAEWFSWEK